MNARLPLLMASAVLLALLSLRLSLRQSFPSAPDLLLPAGIRGATVEAAPDPPPSLSASRAPLDGGTRFSSSRPRPPFNFSACLILQDDNKVLSEWLAYHYHFLPLRHLVVSADPGNVTSPEAIFDQWRAMGMRIDVWPGENLEGHVTGRHWKFIPKCLRYLQGLKRTWTVFIDTDEYMLFNRALENEPEPPACGHLRRERNATAMRECANRAAGPHRRSLPEVGGMTAAEYIHSTMETNPLWNEYPCVTFPRVFFGSHESSAEEVASGVPARFNGTLFQTLRYRKFALFKKPGKSIVDATRYDGKGFQVHRVMTDKCSSATPHPPLYDALFRVHHYTPSLEVFLSRPNDWRRDKKDYEGRTNFEPAGSDDGIRGWLSSFSRSVGAEKALELTERAIEGAFTDDARIKEKLLKERGRPVAEV